MHGINYKVVDLKDEFTLLEATCYWVDIPAYSSFSKIPDGNKSEVKLVMNMLLQAGKEERLKYAKPPGERQYRLPRSIFAASGHHEWHREHIGGPEYTTLKQAIPPTFHRTALRVFAENIGQRPLFLFPDDRRSGQRSSTLNTLGNNLELSKSICNLITECNEKAHVLGSNDIFKPTNKMMKSIKNIQHLSCNDEKTFGDFIDCLYFMLYEGAGKGLRVKSYLSDEEYQPVHDIRDIRNFYYRHDIEHGDSGEIKKKNRKLGEIFLRLIKKPLPENEIDFKKAQYVISDNLHNMLVILYKKIN